MNAAVDSHPSKISLNYIDMPFGYGLYQSKGYAMNDEHINAFKETKLILKGPVTIPPGDTSYYIRFGDKQYTSPNQALRKIFQLYANVRPAKSCEIKGFDNIKQFNNLDIIVVRENTEDLYSGEEYFFTENDTNCTNPININDNIVFVGVASQHRKDAFEACEFIMDFLKTNATFWKKEHHADGKSSWVDSRKTDDDALNRWQ